MKTLFFLLSLFLLSCTRYVVVAKPFRGTPVSYYTSALDSLKIDREALLKQAEGDAKRIVDGLKHTP